MTPKKPIIGITPSHNTENNDTSLRPTYPKAIATAGGLAILLPLECSNEDIKQFMDVCDGFLFTGGPDINPFLFGEDTHLKCGNICCQRSSGISSSHSCHGRQKACFRHLPRYSGVKYMPWRKPVSGYLFPDKTGFSHRSPAAILL